MQNILKSRIFKSILCVLTAVSLSLGVCYLPIPGGDVRAESITSMKEKINGLESEKTGLKTRIDELQGKVDKQQAYVDTLNSYIATVESKITASENLLSTYQGEIDDLNREIEKKEDNLAENKELFKRRIRSIYMSGANTSMSILLGSDKFADYLSMTEFTESLAKYDNALMKKINLAVADINKTIKKKNAAIKEQQNIKKDLASDRQELQSKQSEAQNQLNNVNKSKEELQAEMAQVDASIASLEKNIDAAYEAARQAAIKKQQEEEAARRKQSSSSKESGTSSSSDGSGNNSENSGGSNGSSSSSSKGYTWPLPGYTMITSQFGNRFDPYYKVYRGHKGIDISGGGVAGKPIVATADGTVTVAEFNNGGYGNYVVISHGFKGGKLITSHYGHMMSYVVSVGQEVKKGDVIGYVGTTGASMGYHLHFEMREDNIPVNPFNYVSY